MSIDCDHVWGEGEDWVFDDEGEYPITTYECEKCSARMTPTAVNDQLNVLRAERDALRMAVQQIYGLLDPRMDNRAIAADRCFIIAEQVLAQMERRRNHA